MFSGIVKGIGRIVAASAAGPDLRLSISTAGVPLPSVEVGGSIAVNGVCLTAVDRDAEHFAADVSAATLAATTLGGFAPGMRVNLEPSLRLGDPLDGHLVLGHVDGVGRVVAVEPSGGSQRLVVELPAGLERFVTVKGSITVDGVSLTVNDVEGRRFTANVIPHTAAVTIAGSYVQGAAVNIEVDPIARYVERLLGQSAVGFG